MIFRRRAAVHARTTSHANDAKATEDGCELTVVRV